MSNLIVGMAPFQFNLPLSSGMCVHIPLDHQLVIREQHEQIYSVVEPRPPPAVVVVRDVQDSATPHRVLVEHRRSHSWRIASSSITTTVQTRLVTTLKHSHMTVEKSNERKKTKNDVFSENVRISKPKRYALKAPGN